MLFIWSECILVLIQVMDNKLNSYYSGFFVCAEVNITIFATFTVSKR